MVISANLPVLASTARTAIAASQQDDPATPRKELTSEELQALIDSALVDVRVQEHLKGKNYAIMSYEFVGNVNDQPFAWYPEIHINIENATQLTILFGKGQSSNTSISALEELPMALPIQAIPSSNHGFATNDYTGSDTPNGIRLNTVAPRQSTGDVGMVFLVNGITVGSNDNNGCNAASYGSTYFAQIGFQWTTGPLISWADTATNCVPQFPLSTQLSYVSGNSYDFRVYSSSGQWNIYGKDNSNGQVFTKPRSGVTSAVLKNNDLDTSVWLETQTTSPNGSILSSSPSGTASISKDSGSTWINWQSGSRNDRSCTHVDHVYPYDSSKEVISGNLAGGSTATWNAVRMATNYPGC